MKDKDMIDLIYVSNDKTYKGHIDRATFLDQMSHMVKWFAPDCNENAKKLCSLIPEFTSITVTQTVFDSKDVPFFEYTTIHSNEPNIFEFMRPHSIIQDFLLYYCNKAILNTDK